MSITSEVTARAPIAPAGPALSRFGRPASPPPKAVALPKLEAPPPPSKLAVDPPVEALTNARAEARRALYEEWSAPFLGFGRRAHLRGWIVAYPHIVGSVLLGLAVLSVVVHVAGGHWWRPTVTGLVGVSLVLSDRLPLTQPGLRLLAYGVAMVVGIGLDAATSETLFAGWDR